MAKGTVGKLAKLKCMLKKWHAKSTTTSPHHHRLQEGDRKELPENDQEVPAGMRPVYVGKSRRRYLIDSNLVGHPLFQVLVERSRRGGAPEDVEEAPVVGCEVVLFEHLLWMLENADPQPEAVDELVDFYSC